MYQLVIDENLLTLEFLEVPLSRNTKPSPRTAHSMIDLEGGNAILIGGVGLEGTYKDQLLRDMWIFNTDELSWTRVDPANGILRGFCEGSLCKHNNKIMIIGGLAERLDTWN